MIDGEVEEALDLLGVQVHRHHPVGACGGEQVGHELGRDRFTRQALLVLAGVPVIGDDGGDALGRSALQRVEHDELFHDGVVDVVGVSLDDEDVGSSNALVGPEVCLTV